MNKRGPCSSRKLNVKPGCHTKKSIETFQPFPPSGHLAENFGLPLPVLKSQMGRTPELTPTSSAP
jgi:hypothetical protein